MKTAYTYTVLRYVHDTLTGEFLNVGVAIMAGSYSGAKCRSTYGRLSNAFPGVDGESFKSIMRFIQDRINEIGRRESQEFPFNGEMHNVMDVAKLVLPADDSSLQWAPMQGGITSDPQKELDKIYQRFVESCDRHSTKETRSDDEIWQKYSHTLKDRDVIKQLQPHEISVSDDAIKFAYTWKNGRYNCLQPISLDLTQAESIVGKAHRWLGQTTSVKDSSESFKIYYLLGKPNSELLSASYENAIKILDKSPIEHEIIEEENAESFSVQFAEKMLAHG